MLAFLIAIDSETPEMVANRTSFLTKIAAANSSPKRSSMPLEARSMESARISMRFFILAER